MLEIPKQTRVLVEKLKIPITQNCKSYGLTDKVEKGKEKPIAIYEVKGLEQGKKSIFTEVTDEKVVVLKEK